LVKKEDLGRTGEMDIGQYLENLMNVNRSRNN